MPPRPVPLPIASEVKTYLRQLVDRLREFRGGDDVDWGQVESRTLAAAGGAGVIGLSPLMGDGTVFKMQCSNSVVPFNSSQSSIKANGEELQMNLGKFRLSDKRRRIAVRVDGGTAGVGELLAIAFMGRDDARVFTQYNSRTRAAAGGIAYP